MLPPGRLRRGPRLRRRLVLRPRWSRLISYGVCRSRLISYGVCSVPHWHTFSLSKIHWLPCGRPAPIPAPVALRLALPLQRRPPALVLRRAVIALVLDVVSCWLGASAAPTFPSADRNQHVVDRPCRTVGPPLWRVDCMTEGRTRTALPRNCTSPLGTRCLYRSAGDKNSLQPLAALLSNWPQREVEEARGSLRKVVSCVSRPLLKNSISTTGRPSLRGR